MFIKFLEGSTTFNLRLLCKPFVIPSVPWILAVSGWWPLLVSVLGWARRLGQLKVRGSSACLGTSRRRLELSIFPLVASPGEKDPGLADPVRCWAVFITAEQKSGIQRRLVCVALILPPFPHCFSNLCFYCVSSYKSLNPGFIYTPIVGSEKMKNF